MNTIRNERLEVTFRYDPQTLFSERFEAAGVVEQVCLDGTWRFCEPEQRIAGRVTCSGTGLCGEYVWDELAGEAAPGEQFPKLGVGLLTQRPEGGPYNMWRHYETRPFPLSARFEADRAVFVQEPLPCLGVAARITKTVGLNGTCLYTETALENLGSRPLQLREYQHNFVSLNGEPVGPGYRLTLPMDGEIEQIADAAYDVRDFRLRRSGFMRADGDSIVWNKPMDGHGWHKVTTEASLHPERGAYWKLTHDRLPLSVCEELSFAPQELVLWGVEHCICTELYIPIEVQPGQTFRWKRQWRFEAGQPR